MVRRDLLAVLALSAGCSVVSWCIRSFVVRPARRIENLRICLAFPRLADFFIALKCGRVLAGRTAPTALAASIVGDCRVESVAETCHPLSAVQSAESSNRTMLRSVSCLTVLAVPLCQSVLWSSCFTPVCELQKLRTMVFAMEVKHKKTLCQDVISAERCVCPDVVPTIIGA